MVIFAGFDKLADLLLSLKPVIVKTMGKIFSNYVCFSESPNFNRVANLIIFWKKFHLHTYPY